MTSFAVVCALLCVAVATAHVVPSVDQDEFDQWSSRIVGGQGAAANQFPYQVSLQGNPGGHFCGGSIINNRWIVSAAHCTINRSPANTRIRVGTNFHASGGVHHAVSAIRNHPSYNGQTLTNDICTLQTATTIVYNAAVQPIGLSWGFTGVASAVVSGWGQTTHPGSAPAQLQFLRTTTLTNADCRSRHSFANAARVFDNTICAFTQRGQGSCMGDSGGPLVVNGQLVGAVSWGIPCGVGSPDVYARISSHASWIQANS